MYVQRLWYTRVVDTARGVITGTTRDAAFLVQDGRLVAPVQATRFTESVLDALERVDGVAIELHGHPIMNVWNGATVAPAMRVRGFRLGAATGGNGTGGTSTAGAFGAAGAGSAGGTGTGGDGAAGNGRGRR